MIVGVTGTREGMTDLQKMETFSLLQRIITAHPGSEFHHGDCMGVDVQAAACAKVLGFKIICHPPDKDGYRGWFMHNDLVLTPAPYKVRDKAIVDASEFMLVVPKHMEPQQKGGTWYTYRYALRTNTPLSVVWPQQQDGVCI